MAVLSSKHPNSPQAGLSRLKCSGLGAIVDRSIYCPVHIRSSGAEGRRQSRTDRLAGIVGVGIGGDRMLGFAAVSHRRYIQVAQDKRL